MLVLCFLSNELYFIHVHVVLLAKQYLSVSQITLTDVLFNEVICFDFGRKTLKMTSLMKVMMTMLGLSLLLDVLISQVKHCATDIKHK